MADDLTTKLEKTPTQLMVERIANDTKDGGVKIIEPKAEDDKVILDGDGNVIVKEEKKPGKENEYDYSLFKDVSEDEIVELNKLELDTNLRYKLVQTTDDMKKAHRLVSTREKEITDMKSRFSDSKVSDYEDFIKEMKRDVRGGWNKYQDKLGLPDIGFMEGQFKEGNSIEDRLAQFQGEQLIPDIEAKFKLEKGTFVFDPAEAHRAKTPSFAYRSLTESKENELKSEHDKNTKQVEERLKDALENRKLDIINLKKNYFPSSEMKDDMSDEDKTNIKKINELADGEFTSLLGNIDEMFTKIREGNISQETNPMSLTNIFRGVHFDYLVDRIKKETAESIHKQYREKGLFMRDEGGKPLPTVVDKIKGNSDIEIPDYLSEEKTNRSPLLRSVTRTLKEASSNQ